jgi:hypothetical protein
MSSKTAENTKTFEEIISNDGELFFTNEGCSMLPLIHAKRDILHIVKLDKELELGDVVLYSDKPHHYVLHRIIKIKKDGRLICAGDNNYWKDKPIVKEMVFGRLKEVAYPDGKTVNLDKDYKEEGMKYVRFFAWKAFRLRLKRLFSKK